jgi:hypothetical protein
MNLFFWMLLNLGVPIAGPIFTLALVAPAHGWRVAKALIAASVKDGQLFWCAIGLVMSGSVNVHYGRLEAGVRPRTTPSIVQAFSRAEVGISIFFTSVAAILFAFLHVHLI